MSKRGGAYRINIEGLDPKLAALAIKRLEPKVRSYIMSVFEGADYNTRKLGRNYTSAKNALEERKSKVGPQQLSTIGWALQNFKLDKTAESEKFWDFVRKLNPELHAQRKF